MADRATWVKRVGEWRASGRTAAEYCAGRAFSPSTLRWWSSRLHQAPRPAPSVSEVHVVRVERAVAPAQQPERAVVIELGGARVAVERGFDRETLAAVLDVLASCGGTA